ncbi:MAG: DUF350 domain-containing protein [Bryobacteraceae bacterium]
MPIPVVNILDAVLYACLGIVILAVSFIVLDKMTPYDLWKEIVQEHNMALAILISACLIGISIIIAAAVH